MDFGTFIPAMVGFIVCFHLRTKGSSRAFSFLLGIAAAGWSGIALALLEKTIG